MKLQIGALARAERDIDANVVEEAALAISQSRRVDVVATGDSAAIGQSLLFWMTALGFHCRALADSAEQAAAAAFLEPGDVIVAISYSGRTRTVVEAATRATTAGATVIGITCAPRSPLARNSSLLLAIDAGKAATSEGEWPLRTAMAAVARALSLAVQSHLSVDDAAERRALWASGRFGLRYA